MAVEEVKCQALADNAQKDLEEALPALEEAMRVPEAAPTWCQEWGWGQPSLPSESLGNWGAGEGGIVVGPVSEKDSCCYLS